MKIGAKATISELGVEDGVGLDEFGFAPRFYRLRDDHVAIMVVEYHMALAAANGGDGEAASLVCGDFTSQFNYLNKNLVIPDWGLMLAWDNNRGWCDCRFG